MEQTTIPPTQFLQAYLRHIRPLHHHQLSSREFLLKLFFILCCLSITSSVYAEYYPGYTLFTPHNSRTSYLINQSNQNVHVWNHSVSGGYSLYLKENGHLVRTAQVRNPYIGGGGGQGLVQELDWDGNLVWQYTYSSNSYLAHHDIEIMPNGNILMIAWEMKSSTEVRQAGFSRSVSLWPDHIIEVEPSGSSEGNIVWEWHSWDHLIQDYDSSRDNYGVVADHPELLDINMSGAGGMMGGDWMHANGISYDAELDHIVISSHNLDEIFVIDHSTTTAEAATHNGGNSGMGGDILYRWGKPSNYDTQGTTQFNVVHCPVWIPEDRPGGGHLLAFNNREGSGSSQVVELAPPIDDEGNYIHEAGTAFGPAEPVWDYTANDFYSNHLGACQRLPNGNTLICASTSGFMFEVDSEGNRVWSNDYNGEVVRVLRYGINYPGVYNLNAINEGEIALNEIMLVNDGSVTDPAGEADAWIELFNNGDEEHSLSGFTLTSSLDIPAMWVFPDTVIVSGGYIVVWLDGDTQQEGLHCSIEASSGGGNFYLLAPDESEMDHLNAPSSVDSRSYGRYPNGTGDFQTMVPTFATENTGNMDIKETTAGALPHETTLKGFFPNPFNSSTLIRYDLATFSPVQLFVYNLLGERVALLVDETQPAGEYRVTWAGINDHGLPLASGSYVVLLKTNRTYVTQTVVLLK